MSWLAAGWPDLLAALAASLTRLGLGVGFGLLLGLGLAALMRAGNRMEALLTPWVLALSAVPWLLIMLTLNMVPNLGLSEPNAALLAALATAMPLWSLGRHRLEQPRASYLRRALWSGFAAVMAGELLSRSDGIGAKIRFFALFTQYDRLALYIGVALLLALGFALLARGLAVALRRTPLWTAGAGPARPDGRRAHG